MEKVKMEYRNVYYKNEEENQKRKIRMRKKCEGITREEEQNTAIEKRIVKKKP